MVINKKDIRRIDQRVLNKAQRMLNSISTQRVRSLNIDKDVKSIDVDGHYRLVYRASTMLTARLLTHNNYNRIISYRYVGDIR